MNNMTEEDEWKRLADIVATALIERDKAKDDLFAMSGLLARGLKREAALIDERNHAMEHWGKMGRECVTLSNKIDEITVSRNTWRAEAKRVKKLMTVMTNCKDPQK